VTNIGYPPIRMAITYENILSPEFFNCIYLIHTHTHTHAHTKDLSENKFTMHVF